jgi:3-oxoacyl-[acyl-carrier-protein] synthase III
VDVVTFSSSPHPGKGEMNAHTQAFTCVHTHAQLHTFTWTHLQGAEVFKFAVRSVPQVIEKALNNAGMQKEQIDWLVMHQVRF